MCYNCINSVNTVKGIGKTAKGEVKLDRLIFFGYEFAAGFIPFIIALAVWGGRNRKKGKKLSKAAYIFAAVFAVYIIGVYHFTGAGTVYDMMRYDLALRQDRLNYIPFSNHIDVTAYLLNVVMFIPLGILVPFICGKMNKFFCISGIGLGFSLFIETSQLLNNRASDIDDLIMNTCGAVVGYVIFKIFDKCIGSKMRIKDLPVSVITAGIFIPFMGRFFLFNEMGMAKMLYGF